ncbi:MAG: type II toxin-antitoxin system HicB family antitoxin [Oscillospiraceae bacterium]|nr:type II toxin-antitoxin system HicB family antitoxin [Oscillospiraceae bacterium]
MNHKYIYPACFYPEENGQYSVVFNDLGGIATYGNDLQDALNMAEDLLCTWILECKKDGEELPAPTDIRDVVTDCGKGFVSLVSADINAYILKNNKSVKKTLTIPFWLNELAEKSDVNYSQLLQSALKAHLHVAE